MSVLVKGIDVPKNCTACQFGGFGGAYNELDVCMHTGSSQARPSKERMKDCPLIEIPTPHGRLIDADALPKYTGYALSANEVANAVENAPTVIEGE